MRYILNNIAVLGTKEKRDSCEICVYTYKQIFYYILETDKLTQERKACCCWWLRGPRQGNLFMFLLCLSSSRPDDAIQKRRKERRNDKAKETFFHLADWREKKRESNFPSYLLNSIFTNYSQIMSRSYHKKSFWIAFHLF